MDSRLKMSGMTEGELKAGGMTEGLLCLFVMPRQPLTPALSRKGRGRRMPLCHARRASLSCLLVLFVMPPGPLCHSRRLLAGIQHLALLFFLFVWPLHGRSHGFPITNVGNDRRGD